MNKEDVLAALAELSESELREVRARSTVLLGAFRDTSPAEEDPVFTALQQVVSSRGIPFPPFSRFVKTSAFPVYQKSSSVVLEFVDVHICPASRTHRLHVLIALVEALIVWMQEAKVPLKPLPLCQQLGNLPARIDEWFPGYRASGLLGLLSTLHFPDPSAEW